MTKQLKVTMLGHRGVGKTSLLTAMYEQFDNTIGEAGLQLTPDAESSALLQKKLGELKTLLYDLYDFEGAVGLKSDDEPQSFKFGIGKTGAKTSLEIIFQDFPGEYLDGKNEEFIEKTMRESVAVLVAIDAPPLMEVDGRWNDLVNTPKQILNVFQRYYADLQEPRLVILAPIRCEKYLQNELDANDLLHKIKDKYKNLLKFFNSENLSTKVACVVTPVQTVGILQFSRIQVDKGTPNFYFRKISHDAIYTPKDGDQPLRYILSFILKLHLDKQWGLFNWLHNLLRWDDSLKEAARKSALQCKSSNGFCILQGKDRLEIKK